MAIKKTQLYSMLWSSCDALRGAMDASQYKDYVLVLLFVKYMSDKAKYDRNSLVVIPEGCTFDDFVKLKNQPNIGEEINKKLAKIAAEYELEGVLTNADFNDTNRLGKGKNLVSTVSNLIGVFENANLDMGKNHSGGDDLIGDAYEYLMRNFAQDSGKSKGQFYTPAEVSRLVAKLIGIADDDRDENISIYDPACGSGSLLLRAKAEAKGEVSLNGQESDLSTIGMARMNMMLHGEQAADLRHDDTLNSPQHTEGGRLSTFDYVVANPPFSLKQWWKHDSTTDPYNRWNETIGVPPASCGDYAWLLHIINSLKPGGKGACILPHGVLFRGGSEAKIRQNLIEKFGYIKGVVGLPSNLFYGTGIPACIVIVEKPKAGELQSRDIFFIDAKDGFKKDGPKNRLREQDIRRISDIWQAQIDIPHVSHKASFVEIEKNNFNLNVPRYVSPRPREVEQNILCHLHGGLPQSDIDEKELLWYQCPTLKNTLFKSVGEGVYELRCELEKIYGQVVGDASFKEQVENYSTFISLWQDDVRQKLYAVGSGSNTRQLIESLTKTLMEDFETEESLVFNYDAYDALYNYWNSTMLDDCCMIRDLGWKAEVHPPYKDEKQDTFKSSYKWDELESDLLPATIVARKHFADKLKDMAAVNKLLESQVADKDKYYEDNKKYFFENKFGVSPSDAVIKRIAKFELKNNDSLYDQATKKAWRECMKKIEECEKTRKTLKLQNDLLCQLLMGKYKELGESEVREMVVEDKWLTDLENAFKAEMEKTCNNVVAELTSMCNNYATSLDEITQRVERSRNVVDSVFEKMGIKI